MSNGIRRPNEGIAVMSMESSNMEISGNLGQSSFCVVVETEARLQIVVGCGRNRE